MEPGVAIVGAGHTRFGALTEGPRALLAEAAREALAGIDRGLPRGAAVDEAFLATLGFGGWQIGNASAVLAESAGMVGVPVTRIENACASGGYAIRAAAQAIRSGRVRVALVAGVEKMTDTPSARRRYWLGVSGDTEWERSAGLTFAGVYGMIASRYAHERPRTREALTAVAVKNHANGARNPKAHLRKAVRAEEVEAAPPVADPLRLFDCCPVTDGAAALVLADASIARRCTDTPVWIGGIGAASDVLAVQERPTLLEFPATRRAAAAAYADAGWGPESVDVLEVHDCFTIAELLALEDLGIAPRGGGAIDLTLSGATGPGGERPVNPDGGLKAKGHPIGTTGVSQLYELFLQLRAAAGNRQVPGAERALAHNVGGSGASATVTLVERG
ncbi:MAG: beta-ketoacyl synthase N-terminal-like domain-containing protein [Thermoplasmata archaeon]